MVDVDIGTGEKLVLAGLVAVGLSMMVPYLTASEPLILVDGERQTSQLGMQTADGQLMFGGAVLAALAAVVGSWGIPATGVVGLSGFGITGLSLLYLSDPVFGAEYSSADVVAEIDAGVGLYLAALGGLLLLAGAYTGRQHRHRSPAQAVPPRQAPNRNPGGSGPSAGPPPQGTGDTQSAQGHTDQSGAADDGRPAQPVADRPHPSVSGPAQEQTARAETANRQPAAASGETRWVPGSNWHVVAAGGLALFCIGFSVLVATEEGVVGPLSSSGESFIGLLLLLSWVMIPSGILLDLRYVNARTAWTPRTFLWGIPVLVPFLNALVVAVYLYKRRSGVGSADEGSEQ